MFVFNVEYCYFMFSIDCDNDVAAVQVVFFFVRFAVVPFWGVFYGWQVVAKIFENVGWRKSYAKLVAQGCPGAVGQGLQYCHIGLDTVVDLVSFDIDGINIVGISVVVVQSPDCT